MRVLQFLQLCRRARRIELGDSPVRAAVSRGRAKLLLLARDAADNSKNRVKTLSKTFNVPFLELDLSKEEFGALFSRAALSMAAITDSGMARSFLEKLDPASPLLVHFASDRRKSAFPPPGAN